MMALLSLPLSLSLSLLPCVIAVVALLSMLLQLLHLVLLVLLACWVN